MPQRIASVVFSVPVDRAFHYVVPPGLRVERGARVLVPFGSGTRTGYVVGFADEPDVPEVKPIRRVLDEEPLLTNDLLRLTRWMADYYFCSWGEAIRAALPAGLEARGTQSVEITDAGRDALRRGVAEGKARAVLGYLMDVGVADLRALRERLNMPEVRQRVTSLAEAGFVVVSDRVIPPAAFPRVERVVRMAAGPYGKKEYPSSSAIRSQRARDMLAALAQRGEISLAEVRQQWGVASSTLQRLEAVGIV